MLVDIDWRPVGELVDASVRDEAADLPHVNLRELEGYAVGLLEVGHGGVDAEVPVRLLSGGEGGPVGLRGGLVLSGGEALGADGEGLAGLLLDDLLELQVQEVTPPDAADERKRGAMEGELE